MKLSLKALHIVFGHDPRVDMIFNGIVFGGKSEGIPAHRIQNVVALHSPFAGHNIQSRIRPGVPYMKSLARGVREFNQCIVFRFRVIGRSLKGLLVIPDLLPFCFHFSVIIWYCHLFPLISAALSCFPL